MAKAKYNDETGYYKLAQLTHAEMELIAKLCANITLGKGDEYREAALGILRAFERDLDSGFVNAACDNITLEAVAVDVSTQEEHAKIYADSLHLRVTSSEQYSAN